MSLPSEPLWRRYLRFFGPDIAADVDDELGFHLEMREQAFLARGYPPEAAREAARKRFGDIGKHRRSLKRQDTRRLRRARWSDAMGAWGQDLRYAFRMLWHHRGFSLAVIATLALGTGATTAIFSAVDAAMLRPLPFADPERLVELRGVNMPFSPDGNAEMPDQRPTIRSVGALREVYAEVAAFALGGLNLSGIGPPMRIKAGVVTEGFFRTLGVSPAQGRTFSADEGRPHGPLVTVISHRLWQQQFAGLDAVGKSLRLNGKTYQVIGIMPAGFRFPEDAELWTPLTVPMTFQSFEAFGGFIPSVMIGRIAPSVSRAAAAERLRVLWRQLPAEQLEEVRSTVAEPLRPFQDTLVGDRRAPMLILLGATALLLLIACVNVTNLLLAHAATRERELAVRTVLGASRGRLIRQLLVQSLVLSLAGAAAGIALAYATFGLVSGLLPRRLIDIAPPALDVRLLAFATGLAVVTGLAFGLLPALGATRTDTQSAMKSGGGHGSTAARRGRIRRVLVTAELALALMLLAASGLMLRSFQAVLATDTGFQREQVATLKLSFDRGTYQRGSRIVSMIDRLLERIRLIPGVQAAGTINDLPLSRTEGISIRVDPEEGPLTGRIAEPFARFLKSDAGYFKAMGIRLLAGRLMSPGDDSLAPAVMVVSEKMAREVWPGQDPLGKRIRLTDPDTVGFRAVIGVVSDIRERPEEATTWQMYYPIHESAPTRVALVVRGTLAEQDLLAALRAAVQDVDPNQPVYEVRTLNELMSSTLMTRRSNTTLITAFGGLALLLAVVGVYGVVAYGVTLRTRELGIRVALGADRSDLVRMVLGEGMRVAAIGVAVGLVGTWVLAKLLQSLLYGVGPSDPVAIAGAALLLTAPVLAATFIPARRAARANPVDVMRSE
jgi:putative ABC transport system permease protein